jgi:hypothetical protein
VLFCIERVQGLYYLLYRHIIPIPFI